MFVFVFSWIDPKNRTAAWCPMAARSTCPSWMVASVGAPPPAPSKRNGPPLGSGATARTRAATAATAAARARRGSLRSGRGRREAVRAVWRAAKTEIRWTIRFVRKEKNCDDWSGKISCYAKQRAGCGAGLFLTESRCNLSRKSGLAVQQFHSGSQRKSRR